MNSLLAGDTVERGKKERNVSKSRASDLTCISVRMHHSSHPSVPPDEFPVARNLKSKTKISTRRNIHISGKGSGRKSPEISTQAFVKITILMFCQPRAPIARARALIHRINFPLRLVVTTPVVNSASAVIVAGVHSSAASLALSLSLLSCSVIAGLSSA